MIKFIKLTSFLFIFSHYYCQTSIVNRVIDGDTFETEKGQKVRMIGINAPEISDIYGVESKLYLKKLIEGKEVFLSKDKLNKDKDRYGRLLRYVYLDSVDINKQMIIDGYAFAYLKFKFLKSSIYRKAQVFSSQKMMGMWNNGKVEVKEKEIKDVNYFSKKNLIVFFSILLFFLGIYFTFKK